MLGLVFLAAIASSSPDAEMYPFDTVTAKVTGVLFGSGANTDPTYVVPQLYATFRKADGETKEHWIYAVNHKGSFVANLRLTPEMRRELGAGAKFLGVRLEGGRQIGRAHV